MPAPIEPPPALSVTALTAQLKAHLESGFTSVWVVGEVSNFSSPQSGHCYFTLKDDNAQLRAVMWRSAAAKLKFDLTDGLELICHGHIDLYGPRGSYQLVVDQAHPKGVGALELALRKLRDKLAKEGLFDPRRKRPLPIFPRRIGFVTSPTGAAVRDFLEVLRRRWAGAQVLIIPARVQGEGAAEEIAAGIRAANKLRPALDVLVIGRGGGSIEDLWAFNEEPVVRAIAASKIPTVSAVGHEIDITLADLAADVRALTPSEAAERVVPSAEELAARLRSQGDRLTALVRRMVLTRSQRVQLLAGRRPLAKPFAYLQDHARRVDELGTMIHRAIRQSPRELRLQLATLAGQLESLSPLAVLGRGYSLTQHAQTGRLVRSIRDIRPGHELQTRVTDGVIHSTAERVVKN